MPIDMETRLAALENNQAEFRLVVKEIRDILEKLVRLEERHAESREALGRAFGQIEKLETEVDAIKIVIPSLVELRKWVVAGILGAVGLIGVALISLVIMKPGEPQQIIYQQAPSAIQNGGKSPAP
jgi:hypothetical protein